MKELYRHHDKEDYNRVKKTIFSFSVIGDAISVVHSAIEDEITSYLWRTSSGEYKNVSLQDTREGYNISLFSRAKSALLNRKIVKRKSAKGVVTSPEKDAVKEFEKMLYKPEEDMKFPND